MSKIFEMKKFGKTLTDRPDGKKAYQELETAGIFPDTLDFQGVMSLGSSFGDEVLPKLASKHNNKLKVVNANPAIKACIARIVEDSKIEIIY